MTSTFWGPVPPVNVSEPFASATEPSPDSCGEALSVMNTRGFAAAAADPERPIAMSAEQANWACMIPPKGGKPAARNDFENGFRPFPHHFERPLHKTLSVMGR